MSGGGSGGGGGDGGDGGGSGSGGSGEGGGFHQRGGLLGGAGGEGGTGGACGSLRPIVSRSISICSTTTGGSMWKRIPYEALGMPNSELLKVNDVLYSPP